MIYAGKVELSELSLNYSGYDEYIDVVNKINDVEDPFYVTNKAVNGTCKYMVSDIESAWVYFSNLLDESLFLQIESLIDLIINDINPKFNLPVDQHYYANILGYNPNISDDLKHGFLETLAYVSNLDLPISYRIKNKVKEVLLKINTNKEWFAISELLPFLIEINPSAVIDKIEEDLKKTNSSLLNLFYDKSDDFLFGSSYYTYVIWSLEKALYINGFEMNVIKILTKLIDYDIDYKMTNSPLNTLYNSLVAWSHKYRYSINDKINFVKYVVETSINGWKLLEKLLPSPSSNFITELNTPKYISYQLSDDVINNETVEYIYKEYYKIALENLNDNIDNLCVLYNNVLIFYFDVYNELKDKTFIILGKASDEEKYKLYKQIYELISRYRLYRKSNNYREQQSITILEKEILSGISFEDQSYNYQLVFESCSNILLEPVAFEKKDDSKCFDENRKLAEKLRRDSFDKLAALNINWIEFINRLSDDSPNIIGKYLAEQIQDIDFIEDISHSLYKNKKNILCELYSTLYLKLGLDMIDVFIDSEKLNFDEYLQLLFKSIRVENSVIDYLSNKPEEYKKIFWDNVDVRYFETEELKDLALDNFLKYNNITSMLELVSFNKFTTKQYIDILNKISNSNVDYNQIYNYNIKRIFEKIYQNNFPIKELIDDMVKLEIFYMKNLDVKEDLKYLKYKLSISPFFVSDLIKQSYKKDNGKNEELSNREKQLLEIPFSILFSVKFSPVNNGIGNIDYSELKIWCDNYINKIIENDQRTIGLQYLGRFFANTNSSNDGEFPQKSVKKIIEEIFDDEILKGFEIEIFNSIGVRTVSDGSDLLDMSKKYKKFARESNMYPKTQRILNAIADSFYKEYQFEKESAKYES